MSVLLNYQADPLSGAPQQTVSLARKRELGAFYTPSKVTKVLCNWAIQSPSDIVMEPSFGGCTFLEASMARIQELGESTANNLYGCDIDPNAFDYLRAKVSGVKAENFYLCDFLTLTAEVIPDQRVDAVIGNPPYVRYSKLKPEQREAIHQWEDKYEMRLNRRASLWTYFTFHSLNFLKEGGRMAWVLPVSLMTAQYASGLRATLYKSFHKIAFFSLTERIFLMEGTEERALIVLADGFSEKPVEAKKTFRCLDKVSDLESYVESWHLEDALSEVVDSTVNHGLVPREAGQLLSVLEQDSQVVSLGSLADIGIGVVSGDSKYFIKSYSDWEDAGVDQSFLTYIVPKSRWVTGLSVSEEDKLDHKKVGAPCFALNAPEKPKNVALLRYLAKYDSQKISSSATFAKRDTWFRFLDGETPDGFFVFMTHLGPRLIINEAGANATNSLYRVRFKPEVMGRVKLIAISIQTTFTQLAAERLGRVRGSGALKLEPCDAKSLPIYFPEKSSEQIDEVFMKMDKHMRSGELDMVRREADLFMFSEADTFRFAMEQLESNLETARRRRVRNKHVSADQ